MTQPILLYGSDVWGYSKTNVASIDLLLNWFLRIVLGVKQGTCLSMLYGESGVYPPSVLCHTNVILYYIRLNNLTQNSVLKSAFLDVQHHHYLGTNNNWCSNVKSLALEYNIHIDNLPYDCETKKYVKSVVKEKFISDWRDKMYNMPGLRLYKLFKHDFRCEPYLQNVKNTNFRKMFTRLRTSSHLLEIERGRHVNKPVCERLCSNCNVIEDEFHFVMICPLYEDLRNEFLLKIKNNFPFICQYSLYEQFLFCMGFNDHVLHCLVAKFIHQAFNVRSGVGSSLPPAGDMCQSLAGD